MKIEEKIKWLGKTTHIKPILQPVHKIYRRISESPLASNSKISMAHPVEIQ
ncbi:MAG: hypothetical protein HQL95_11465 [Magnetococcales bacterium]|nr:hypothetical protein [Magnetococcales bacterium]